LSYHTATFLFTKLRMFILTCYTSHMIHSAKVFAVYDISSSSVAGTHVLRTNTVPIILASSRRVGSMHTEVDTGHFLEEAASELSLVIGEVKAKDLHHPSTIQVVLASPWYISQTCTILYKRDSPFTCTKKLIHDLVAAEIEHMQKNQEGAFVAFGTETIVIEKQISGISLNGYRTNTPFMKHASTLELSVLVTVSAKSVLDRFTDTFRRAYGTRHIAYTTSPFASFVFLQDLKPTLDEALLIDVGEEMTDVAFIKHGVILYEHSFPVGTFGLYRGLAQAANNTILEAKTILEAYRLGKLTPSVMETTSAGITSYTQSWQAAFRQIVEDGQYGFCLPSHCMITADPRFEELFTQVLTTDEFMKHRCTISEMKVVYLNSGMLESSVRTSDHSDLDIPLATGILYTNKIL